MARKLVENRIIGQPKTVGELRRLLIGYEDDLYLSGPKSKKTKVKICREKDSPYYMVIGK